MSGRADASPPPGLWLAYLQLFRLPNVFTAIADVSMGFLFVQGSLEPVGAFVSLLAASCLLYTAGMVLNDVFDFDVDAGERPERPLPSGRIAREYARRLGLAMLAAGVLAGGAAGLWQADHIGQASVPVWRSGAVALVLALCVFGYDAGLKATLLGPVVMGACRFLNVLLGMSLGARGSLPLSYDLAHLLVAGGIGIYIIGVTCFARTEAVQSRRPQLLLGIAIMAAGLALLALFPRFAPAGLTFRIEPTTTWPLAMLLLSVTILRSALRAVAQPSPQRVQAAVKLAILSLITLDAAVCALVAPWYWAVALLALLAPALLLGRWVYST